MASPKKRIRVESLNLFNILPIFYLHYMSCVYHFSSKENPDQKESNIRAEFLAIFLLNYMMKLY